MTVVQWMIIGYLGYLGWWISRLQDRLRQVETDRGLREVVDVAVQLEQKYFSEALRLSSGEISDHKSIVSGFSIHLKIWSSHYTGTIKVFRGPGVAPRSININEFPTSEYQFPLPLVRCGLFEELDETRNELLDFGPTSPEKLEVLLSHKSIIVLPRDGRFNWARTGHKYKPDQCHLIVPIRESDLDEYVETSLSDDVDWLTLTGDERFYDRTGDWASWEIRAVYPKPLSSTTAHLDQDAVEPSDKKKTA